MADEQVTLDELGRQLQHRAANLGARNLVLVALPLATAHRDAQTLATALQGEYVDFDCELLQALAEDDWTFHVKQEQRQRFSQGQGIAQRWLAMVAQRLRRERPLVIGNINLAVRYTIDVAAALYDASARGLCVIAAGGRIQDRTLWVHGVQSQTSANAPTYAVITPLPATSPTPPRILQDRFL